MCCFLTVPCPTEFYTLSLHDALPIFTALLEQDLAHQRAERVHILAQRLVLGRKVDVGAVRSEEHTSELQALTNLVCRLLLEKKNPSCDEDSGWWTGPTSRCLHRQHRY